MLKHPFKELEGEYSALLANMRINPTVIGAVNRAATQLVRDKDQFLDVQRSTGVPAVLLMGLMWRERNGDLRYYLGNGQPLTQRTTIVPAGRGPFSPPPQGAWRRGAEDAIHLVHLNDNSEPWSWPYICFKGEAWNGFGPRAHGIHTGYLWAGTNHYTRGKYVSDGRWDPAHVDTQIGLITVVRRALELEPSLGFDQAGPPRAAALPVVTPLPVPAAVSGGQHGTRWLQAVMNKLGEHPPLRLDNNYGKGTREAVRKFQVAHGLTPDGFAGTETFGAIDKLLSPEQLERINQALAAEVPG